MTNEYRIIAPLMLTCVIAVLVSGRLQRDSIYTSKLTRRGVRLSEGKDINVLRAIEVREVMEPDPPLVLASAPFSELVPRLSAGTYPELLVVDHKQRLLGTVSLTEIKGALPDADALSALVVAADVVNRDVPFVLPSEVVLIHTASQSDQQLDGRQGKVPGPDTMLEAGDLPLVIGDIEAVNLLRD